MNTKLLMIASALLMGNFAHFAIAGIALLKAAMKSETTSKYVWVLAIIYTLFALGFGIVSFTNPSKKRSS